jgi:MFS family permease
MSPSASGYVLSSWGVAAIGGTLVAGDLMGRIGFQRTATTGLVLTIASFISLQLTHAFAIGAICSRLVAGLGFGLFIPAAVLFAKDRVLLDRQIHYTGIFTSSMMLPNFFAPAVGEWYLRVYCVDTYFLTMSLPILLGTVACAIWLPRDSGRATAKDVGYFVLLCEPDLVLPNLCVLVTGMLWGFAATFLALWLQRSGVVVAAFFTPFAVGMLATRFLFLRLLQRVAARPLLATGLGLMAVSYVLLATAMDTACTGVAAIAFAIGYGIVYPTVVVWTSNRFPQEKRNRPVALINTLFNAGGIVAPIIGGYLIPAVGFGGNAAFLVLLTAGAMLSLLVMDGRGNRNPAFHAAAAERGSVI